MYVYANPKNKTCEIVESEDILDAIAISKGNGTSLGKSLIDYSNFKNYVD